MKKRGILCCRVWSKTSSILLAWKMGDVKLWQYWTRHWPHLFSCSGLLPLLAILSAGEYLFLCKQTPISIEASLHTLGCKQRWASFEGVSNQNLTRSAETSLFKCPSQNNCCCLTLNSAYMVFSKYVWWDKGLFIQSVFLYHAFFGLQVFLLHPAVPTETV